MASLPFKHEQVNWLFGPRDLGEMMLTADQRKACRLMLYLNSLNVNHNLWKLQTTLGAKKSVRIESYLHPVQHRVLLCSASFWWSRTLSLLYSCFTACYSNETRLHDFESQCPQLIILPLKAASEETGTVRGYCQKVESDVTVCTDRANPLIPWREILSMAKTQPS